jgi:hypothetical protein
MGSFSSLRASKLRIRWLTAALVFSLVSLQLVAADHWHGVADTETCQVCLHAADTPLHSSHLQGEVPAVGYTRTQPFSRNVLTGAVRLVGNRDPPIFS